MLSASLQAFYTIYTAVLLFLTQQLAISRTLVCHVKLTAIHDVSGAWAGLGSALSSVWRQTDVPAAWWMTSAVAAYLVSITVLHVTSSTLLQFQPFQHLYDDFRANNTRMAKRFILWFFRKPGIYYSITADCQSFEWTGICRIIKHHTLRHLQHKHYSRKCDCECDDDNLALRIDSKSIVPFGPVASHVFNASALWPDQIHMVPWVEYEDPYSEVPECKADKREDFADGLSA
ncbi:uncharacterized protein EDB93DRAFT_1106510 [Suillus bovinus]|uniref:uncharacterized protein n=1 Tax=Suillus bovinus TaxID=48563 RepID=UPI001B87D912|nr:uncharacterized protein EDB93DRAFT_1106510 [Suillus bovinus]KAG2137887.1 hypothetical protein EDB93DRAFT_1106510 [Suillus bovinus]